MIWLFVSLFFCLSTSLFVCLIVGLSVNRSACLSVSQPVLLSATVIVYMTVSFYPFVTVYQCLTVCPFPFAFLPAVLSPGNHNLLTPYVIHFSMNVIFQSKSWDLCFVLALNRNIHFVINLRHFELTTIFFLFHQYHIYQFPWFENYKAKHLRYYIESS